MSRIYIGNNSIGGVYNGGNGVISKYPFSSDPVISTISRIGGVDYFYSNSESRITTGVTVPEGTDIAIISCIYGTNQGSRVRATYDEISLGSITATTINEEGDAAHGTVYSCYVVNPPTGTTTLAIDQGNLISSVLGPWWAIIYYSGVNTSDPIYSSFNHVFTTSINSNVPRTYQGLSYPTSGMTVGVWWTWNSSPQPTVNVSGQTEVFNQDLGNPNMLISEEFESGELNLNNGTYVSLVGFSINPSIV